LFKYTKEKVGCEMKRNCPICGKKMREIEGEGYICDGEEELKKKYGAK